MPSTVRDRAGEEDEHPDVRCRVPRRRERAEDDERDSAAERELCEIERELDELALALPAGDDQGDEGAYELPDQKGRRRAEATGRA